MGDAVRIRNLVKTFGATRALDELDMDVAEGEIHGFLGPNGAGKSTTLRVLLGLLRPDSGTATVLGGDPWRDTAALHRRLAYVPGDVSLWPGLSGGEVIDLLTRLRGGTRPRRRAELIDRFELDPRQRCRAYSKGNRQKVALVAALAGETELLILDEPTSGLDPLMESVFRACMAEERARGRTVLLSSHILAEVDALCDRVSIVRAGRVVEAGSLAQLRHLSRTAVSVELDRSPSGIDDLPGVHDVSVEGHRLHCRVDPDRLDALFARLSGMGMRRLTAQPPTLEELFLRHYGSGSAQAEHGTTAVPR